MRSARHASAADDNVAVTMTIGSAVCDPPTPASGAASAPVANWLSPSSAEALPAVRGWSASASAVALGNTSPMLATTHEEARQQHDEADVEHDRREHAEAAEGAHRRPASSSVRGPRRSTSVRLTWLAAMMPPALSAKSTLKSCGEAP